MRNPIEQRFRRHNPTVQAIAALEGLFFNKRGLDGMRMLRRADAFERGDLFPQHARQRKSAGANGLTVHDYSTGATLAEATTEARIVEREVIPQNVKKRASRIGVDYMSRAVHLNSCVRHMKFSLLPPKSDNLVHAMSVTTTLRNLSIAIALSAAIVYAQTPEQKLIASAADALGGKARIQSIKTIVIEGGGSSPNMGQNPTPDAPLPLWKVTEFKRTLDLTNGRMRVEQHRVAQFPFALATDVRQNQSIDGDVAWNTNPDGKTQRAGGAAPEDRRIDMLDNPVVIIRATLDPAVKLSNLRKRKGQQLVDLTTPQGDKLTLAIDASTHLPTSVEWMTSSDNLGDIVNTTTFSDYETVDGVKLPKHYLSKIDFRNWVSGDLQVSKNAVDGTIPDLAAPAAVKAATVQPPPPTNVTAESVGKGVWWLAGSGGHRSVVFEFDDHLTLFEAPASEARSKAVIDKARTLVPGKPLTEVIVSHHHFDHTGGLRTAVAEGLTVITEKGNEAFFKEMVARKATLHPDELARNPKPLKVKLVDDELVLKDKSQEVDLYHVKNNIHSPLLLMAWLPQQKIFVQGDLYDAAWTQHPWGDNYQENLTLRHIDFDKDVPIHGRIQTRAEELAAIAATKK